MDHVTKYLYDLIAKQVDGHKLVVWYEPERAYTDAALTLRLDKATVASYDGSLLVFRCHRA